MVSSPHCPGDHHVGLLSDLSPPRTRPPRSLSPEHSPPSPAVLHGRQLSRGGHLELQRCSLQQIPRQERPARDSEHGQLQLQ